MIREAIFAGKLMAFIKDSGADETNEQHTVIEVTQVEKDGTVEIKFDDRKEEVYLSFAMRDLVYAVVTANGVEP